MAKTTLRKVCFFRATNGIDPATHHPRPLDVLALLQHTHGLEYSHRCVPLDANVRRIVGEVHKCDGFPSRVSVGLVDTEGIPQFEKDGRWKEIRPETGAGVGVKSHASFFPTPTHPIIGFIQGTNGPTAQMLASVFTCRDSVLKKTLSFEEIVRGNPIERLERSTAGRFTFGIRRNALEDLDEFAPDLASAFRMMANQTGAELFELTISVRRFKQDAALGGPFVSFLRSLKRIYDRSPNDVPKATARVREDDGAAAVLLNLLTDKFVVDVSIPLIPGRRRYRDEDAFKIIEQVYADNERELLRAMSVMGAVSSD